MKTMFVHTGLCVRATPCNAQLCRANVSPCMSDQCGRVCLRVCWNPSSPVKNWTSLGVNFPALIEKSDCRSTATVSTFCTLYNILIYLFSIFLPEWIWWKDDHTVLLTYLKNLPEGLLQLQAENRFTWTHILQDCLTQNLRFLPQVLNLCGKKTWSASLPFKTGFPPNWISGLGDRNPQCCGNREAPAQTHLCTFCLDIRAHVISTVSVTFKAPHWFRKFSAEGCRWNCSWSGVLVPKLWCGLCDNCRQWKPLSVWSPVWLSLNKTCRVPLFILLCARNPCKVQGNLTPSDILPTKKTHPG